MVLIQKANIVNLLVPTNNLIYSSRQNNICCFVLAFWPKNPSLFQDVYIDQ